MDEILSAYKKGKFKICLQLISSVEVTDDIVKNLLLENCKLMCDSYIKIFECDPEKIFEMQEQHYLFFEKVTSLGLISSCIPLQLRLNVAFNFTFWLLFYNDLEIGETEKDEYLELINRGLLSVLGEQSNLTAAHDVPGKILSNLINLKNLILNEEQDTVLLILELVLVTIVYIIKLKNCLVKECLKIVTQLMNYLSVVNSVIGRDLKPSSLYLFKFSLCESETFSTDFNVEVINHLSILESTLQFLLGDFKRSLRSLQKNMPTSGNGVWSYLGALNAYELENWNLCSHFLTKMSSLVLHKNFKARLHIMQGKINCIAKKHKKALKEFESALALSPNCPAVYYYVGQEYGNMGLIDSMVCNFEKLVQVIQEIMTGDLEENFRPNFETTLLDFMHPPDEITETEAQYVLALSYGLNENFKQATKTFEKVLEFPDSCFLAKGKRIIELPNRLHILHEASVMNLMHGHLVRAEQIAMDAVDQYVAENVPIKPNNRISLDKDIQWLQSVIHQELLETDLEPKELSKETLYSEDLLLFFPQDVIGLLILADIQIIQEVGEYKSILSNVFSIFSKYLSSVQKKENLDENEKHVLTLVKALAGKTCVTIAAIQIKENRDSGVEKMFKRALSCNRGDRDALCNYYKFLLSAGKSREALKLWKTFFKEKGAIRIDLLHSFSLKYLLRDRITTRELEKIQKEIEATDFKNS